MKTKATKVEKRIRLEDQLFRILTGKVIPDAPYDEIIDHILAEVRGALEENGHVLPKTYLGDLEYVDAY